MALSASSQLPDEIIKEILAPVLFVSDEAFSDTSQKSNPFASYELSTSTILVVCKSWLRVATPLLYETVVLRSKAQAQALSGALKRNEQLGRFIKKLRIEGGYGTFVGEILRHSPTLTDLWVSTALWSNESVAGYTKGFRSVNPRRLIVVDDRLKTSAIRKKVYEALGEAIRLWTKLTSFEINGAGHRAERVEPLVAGLHKASRLEYLSFHLECSITESIQRLSKIPSLKQVRVITRFGGKPSFQKLKDSRYLSGFEMLMRFDQGLYNKVLYESPNKDGRFDLDFAAFFAEDEDVPGVQTNLQEKDENILAAPLDPNWRPLAGASNEDRRKILSSILRHAASLSIHGTSMAMGPQTLQQFRAGLTLVSHEFHELATPFLYEAPMLTGQKGLRALSRSRHAHHIRFLWLQSVHSTWNTVDALSLVLVLLLRCNNLVLVSEAKHRFTLDVDDKRRSDPEPMPYQWSQFDLKIPIGSTTLIALSKNCAGTLRHLHLNIGLASFKGQEDFTKVLNALGQLRELRSITMCGNIESVGDHTKLDVSAERFPADAFSHLERLIVDPRRIVNQFFLYALCYAKLPALSWLQIEDDPFNFYLDPSIENFLSTHGSKLIYLKSPARLQSLFLSCVNVSTWHTVCGGGFDSRSDFQCLDADNLDPDQDVQYALNSIVIPSYQFGPPEAEAILNMDLSRLAKLDKIHINRLEWPKSQRDIEKSTWVKVAEAMVERWNVKLVDRQGIAWVPRLKPVKPARKK
ncbi:hypothetical protein BKA70DRAFT_1562153 [Coprinopsis sp. MPI-PUGE-AT-0042]|nr:hypothetical protein BKA70DRAFT_1562153 [Coprinopsis sp. MPI-PUGE-AT-0042]